MSIIYDKNIKKLSQNSFNLENDKKIKFEGEEIKLREFSSSCINLLDTIVEVYGSSKEDFINRLSEIMGISVIEKNEKFIRVSLPYVSGTKAEEIKIQYLNLINSLEGSIQLKRIC